MNEVQKQLLLEARLRMLRQMPYYGTFIIGLPFVEDRTIPTAATDGFQIKVNPKWLLGGEDGAPPRDREEVIFVLGHETLHCSFKHMLRLGWRDTRLWNVAADYAINQILVDGKVGKMPEPKEEGEVKLLDARFKGMTAEEIYDILEKMRREQNGGKGKGQGKDKMQVGKVVIDLSKADPGGTGGVMRPVDAQGNELTEAQQSELDRALDGRTSTAAAAAKSQGKLPAELAAFIETILKPKIDWRERLRLFVAKVIPTDYTWAKPNRRYLGPLDLYLPSIEKSGCGKILVIMDTSGSVGYEGPDSEGAQYFSEIKAISEDCNPEELHIMYCDAAVHGHDIFRDGEEPVLNVRGRGGTDFRPPFKKIAKEAIDIQCAIYLTDMMGTFPEKEPPYPVLWVATTDAVAPWGETVRLQL